VVNTDVFNEQRVDVGAGLLVQNVLCHGFVNFLTGHFILEFAADRLVHFVHVGADVLARKDGWCTKDTHGLATVVVGIRRVPAGAWVKTVINSEVTDFVVALNGLTGHPFKVLHFVLVQLDQIVVQVVNGAVVVGLKGLGQQLRDHGKTCVGPVDVGGDRAEFFQQVGRVPVIAEDGVRGAFNGVCAGADVVLEGRIGVNDGREVIAHARCGQIVRAGQLCAVLVDAVNRL